MYVWLGQRAIKDGVSGAVSLVAPRRSAADDGALQVRVVPHGQAQQGPKDHLLNAWMRGCIGARVCWNHSHDVAGSASREGVVECQDMVHACLVGRLCIYAWLADEICVLWSCDLWFL